MEIRGTGFDFRSSWTLVTDTFPILLDPSDKSAPSLEQIAGGCDITYNLTELVKTLDFWEEIDSLVRASMEKRLRKQIVPQFWSYFTTTTIHSEEDPDVTRRVGFQQFYLAIEFLFDYYVKYQAIIRKVSHLMSHSVDKCQRPLDDDSLRVMFRSVMLSQLPLIEEYQWIISSFYEAALKVEDLDNLGGIDEDQDETNQEGVACSICMLESHVCCCQERFHDTNLKLAKMGLMGPLVSQSLTNLIYDYIYVHIFNLSKDNFEVSLLTQLEKWLQSVVITWIKKIYNHNADSPNFRPNSDDFIEQFDLKLLTYLYNTYTRIRIDQLFNIIIEYPDSLPALEDLKTCMSKTDLKPHLTRTLQTAMETRLLHPGVSTSDILTAYIAAIRSLKILDPSCLLLETVTRPIHSYLRGREDTMRCVVTSLTEEGPNDLSDELVRGEAPVAGDENAPFGAPGGEGGEEGDWRKWVPDPVEAETKSDEVNTRRSSDIVSMLINVYGSKDLFVNEYRTMLADRLLSQYFCDTEREIRYLELLKLRFGDGLMHLCEVMLKDVADSKRINQNIKQDSLTAETTEETIPVSALILSAQFWPAFKDEKLELHEKMVKQMEGYTSAFATLKGSRTLCWRNHLGVVDLEIEMEGGRCLELAVSPVHATILMHFQDQKTWSLDALSKKMHVPSTILRRKIGLWQSHRLIVESEPDQFVLQESEPEDTNGTQNSRMSDDVVLEDYENESAMASTQDQREEELQTFWSYITGMLMNLDALPIERIHQMLRMFAFQGPTIECSLQELKVFLDRKVREHQLIYTSGLYKLPVSR